jgi:hypothetical protein
MFGPLGSIGFVSIMIFESMGFTCLPARQAHGYAVAHKY